MRQEHGLPMMTELLSHGNDRVVRAMSGALRNLAIDARNRELLGVYVRETLLVKDMNMMCVLELVFLIPCLSVCRETCSA